MKKRRPVRIITIALPAAVARRVAVTAANSSRETRELIADLVSAAMDDLPTVVEDGAVAVESILTLAGMANKEAQEKFEAVVRAAIESETLPGLCEARANLNKQEP